MQNIDLWDGNVKEETEKRKTLPWVVSFCGGGKDEEMEGDCPSKTTKRKLAGLMVCCRKVVGNLLHCHLFAPALATWIPGEFL